MQVQVHAPLQSASAFADRRGGHRNARGASDSAPGAAAAPGTGHWSQREEKPIVTAASKKYVAELGHAENSEKKRRQAEKDRWEADLRAELEYQRSLSQQ